MPPFWEGRRVFMTGATGFIGRYLAEALVRHGAQVSALARPRADTAFLRSLGVRVVPGDVTDPSTILLGDAQMVVHGAAWVGFGLTAKKNKVMWRTNVEGTRNVLLSAADAKVRRFVHVSSVAAVGSTPAGLYAEDRLDPAVRLPYFLSEYERTKWAAQRLVDEADGLKTTSVLPGVVLGLGGGFEPLMRMFLSGRLARVPVGDAPTGVVHVRDVVAGIVAAAEVGDGPYLLVDENLTLWETIELFAKASGRPPPVKTMSWAWLKAVIWPMEAAYHLAGKTPPLSKELYRSAMVPKTYDAARARKELGWTPDALGALAADFEALAEARRPAAAGD